MYLTLPFFIFTTTFLLSEASQCLPKQWQGTELVSFVVNGTISKKYMNVSFDANLQMIAADLYYVQGGKKFHEFSLQDFKNGIEYDVENGKCEKTKITFGFPFCLPDSAIVLLKSYVGAADSKVATTTYQVSDDTGHGSGVFTVTDVGHIPINFQMTSIMNGAPVEIFGVTTGIKDPNVFKIPPICKPPNFEVDEVLEFEQFPFI